MDRLKKILIRLWGTKTLWVVFSMVIITVINTTGVLPPGIYETLMGLFAAAGFATIRDAISKLMEDIEKITQECDQPKE
jgi:hypothetical protein